MADNLTLLLEEAIQIELGLSELYHLFSEKISVDRGFWWQLVMEEKNHAALLRSGIEFLKYNKFPRGLLPDSLEELKKANKKIKNIHEKFSTDPDRMYAFEIAYELENSTGEMHYQNYMSEEINDDLRNIFKALNRADLDHAMRIKKYWESVLVDQKKL